VSVALGLTLVDRVDHVFSLELDLTCLHEVHQVGAQPLFEGDGVLAALLDDHAGLLALDPSLGV